MFTMFTKTQECETLPNINIVSFNLLALSQYITSHAKGTLSENKVSNGLKIV